MRQTGRTSRIIDFAIEQLFNVGEVIITDHTAFEYTSAGKKMIERFIKRVEERFYFNNRIYINRKLTHSIEKSKNGIYFIHFKIEIVENQQDKK